MLIYGLLSCKLSVKRLVERKGGIKSGRKKKAQPNSTLPKHLPSCFHIFDKGKDTITEFSMSV